MSREAPWNAEVKKKRILNSGVQNCESGVPNYGAGVSK
jgi:hypothetical protein